MLGIEDADISRASGFPSGINADVVALDLDFFGMVFVSFLCLLGQRRWRGLMEKLKNPKTAKGKSG